MKSLAWPLLWFMSLLYSAILFSITSADPTVTLANYGKLVGSTSTTTRSGKVINQFMGIKFAESPTGSSRFKAPISVAPTVDTHYVQRPGPPCPTVQNVLNMNKTELMESEDCLHLSVYSTDLTANRPVMVYIHGGAFCSGSAADFPPNYLLEKDIVLVVPQYRLGPFGFLSTQTDEIPGNAGLLDIILALTWVQSNIAQFNGDSNTVTIFGQSAGAALIGGLLLSPTLPTGLFHKAILQSGAALNSWTSDIDPIENARDIAGRAGCNLASIDTINNCFMHMDVLTLFKSFAEHVDKLSLISRYNGIRMTYGPSTPVLPRSSDQLIENIAKKNIPIMGGATKNDGSKLVKAFYDGLSVRGLLNSTPVELFERFKNYIGLKEPTGSLSAITMDRFFTAEQMENGNFTTMADGFIDISSMITNKGPILQTLEANLKSSQPSYLYTIDYAGEFTRFENGAAATSQYPFSGGVHHSDDLIYLFPWPSYAQPLNERDTTFSEKMIDLWTSFAQNSVPTSSDCVEWPVFTTPLGPYMHLNEKCSIGTNYVDEFDVAVTEHHFSSSFGRQLLPISGGLKLIIFSLFIKIILRN